MLKGRRGFTALEIIISIVVLAVAVVPLLGLFSTGRRTAALTEYHVLAQMRARRLLEAFAPYPYAALHDVPRAEGGSLELPFDEDQSAFPEAYQKKVALYKEHVFFDEIKPGLGKLSATISWKLYDGKERDYRLEQLVSDERLSLSDTYSLRQW